MNYIYPPPAATLRHCESPQGAKQSRNQKPWIASALTALRNDDREYLKYIKIME